MKLGRVNERRNFLLMAFHPYGQDACRVSNLIPASSDVAEAEVVIGQRSTTVDIPDVQLKKVWDRAGWYMEAAAELVEDDNPHYDRSLQDDLVHFYIAMRAEEHHSV